MGRLPALKRLPRFPIPGILLARLEVDQRVQGQGLGRYLFEETLGLTLNLARSGPVTFRLLVTDASDAQAARFYERFGFVRLAEQHSCRMVLDLLPLPTAVEALLEGMPVKTEGGGAIRGAPVPHQACPGAARGLSRRDTFTGNLLVPYGLPMHHLTPVAP